MAIFLTNYLKLQILASYNNLKIKHEVKIVHAPTFEVPEKVETVKTECSVYFLRRPCL